MAVEISDGKPYRVLIFQVRFIDPSEHLNQSGIYIYKLIYLSMCADGNVLINKIFNQPKHTSV